MPSSLPERPRILFLFSDTGGGHRSAAEAIIEALHLEYGDQVSTQMVDFLKDFAPRPLNHLPALYPKVVRLPQAWEAGWHLSNGRHRVRAITATVYPYIRRTMRQLIAQYPCDMIVSVHPLANAPLLRAFGKSHPYFITVVTDLVTTHALWYHHKVDLCIVPTEEAHQRALKFGLRPDQVLTVGIPVADRFCQPPGSRSALRGRFGWPQDRPLILLVGGGEGMGHLERSANSIAYACPSAALIIITGRNRNLKAKLEARDWPIPTFVYGFVQEMPEFMRAADVLVTKAGPGTISEALIAGLPMILYDRLPGQEEGNVTYIVTEGAGVWAPRADLIVETLQAWLAHPEPQAKAAAACKRLARPQAARQIARILAEKLNIQKTTEEILNL